MYKRPFCSPILLLLYTCTVTCSLIHLAIAKAVNGRNSRSEICGVTSFIDHLIIFKHRYYKATRVFRCPVVIKETCTYSKPVSALKEGSLGIGHKVDTIGLHFSTIALHHLQILFALEALAAWHSMSVNTSNVEDTVMLQNHVSVLMIWLGGCRTL